MKTVFLVENENFQEALEILSRFEFEPSDIQEGDFRSRIIFKDLDEKSEDTINNLLESI